jgi:hypothetical protein
LIICNNVLEILAASLFTVCLVKLGFHVSGETFESECGMKEMKICVAVEIQ